MRLTGKAKEDFSYSYNMSNFNEYSEVLKNALIIEFFDSVGIYIEINKSEGIFWLYDIKVKNEKVYISALEPMQKTRQEATEKAIEHANLIYNEKLKGAD